MNTTAFARREVARTPDGELTIVEAPPYGVGVQAADELVLNQHKVTRDGLVLANEHLRAELGEDGTVLSLVDRATGREALAAPGNRLELYDDRPVAFEAWDIDPFHLETRQDCPPATSYEVVTDSPLRAEVAFERAIGEASTMRQVVRLDAGSRRLEFHTEIDWHEERTLLKTCFPLAVRAPNATYEMQFGYAERPTHYSTSHDRARYEVPGHRFADLSEHGFGVAVLTDCKYGYSCYGNELRISLLRASKSPDPEADMGRHEFAYAVLPHAGGWREGGVVAEAALFNQPLRQCQVMGKKVLFQHKVARTRRWTTRTSCSTRSSGPRTRTRSCCASTRRTARAASRAFDSRCRSTRPTARTRSRTSATSSRSTGARSSSRTARTRS